MSHTALIDALIGANEIIEDLSNRLNKVELERARGDKAREAFKAEIAKREAKGTADALFETGLQAYRLFNYYAKECEKLEEQIKHLSELNDKLQEQITPKGSYNVAQRFKRHIGLSKGA